MNLEDQVSHLHACVKHNAPKFAAMGLQYIGFDPNNPIARFSDKADPLPMVLEYQVNTYGQHLGRLTIRTFGMGITMATPWLTFDSDVFPPRLKRMRHFADILRANM